MHTRLREIVAFVLALSVLAVGGAQDRSAAQQVVERFAEALSAGHGVTALQVLGSGATWSEHDLYWRTASGPAAGQRALELIRAGVRLETEVVAVVADGRVVIAHERMWADFVPEGMAPLRSTTVYVVEGGWLVGITRELSVDQRDALTLATLADSTWEDRLIGGVFHRFGADGTYRNYESLDALESGRHVFSGTYALERGVFTWIAAADSTVCDPGERFVMRGRLIDADTWNGVLVPDETDCAFYRERLTQYKTYRLAGE